MKPDVAKIRNISWLILATVVAHLLLYRLPPINQEWAFVDAARYFETHQPDFLARYFSVQANTLGVPFLVYAIHKAISFLEIGSIPRLLAASGFIFMGAALVRINRLTGSKIDPIILLAAVFLNPLIWTFGGRGTADFFPAALALFSLSLFWDREVGVGRLGIAILMFGIAITLKYHAMILLPIVWIEALTRAEMTFKRTFLKLTLCTILILLLPVGYLFTVKENFGFWFAPAAFQNMHHMDFNPSFVAKNFIAYMGYLALLCFPLSFFFIRQQVRGWRRMRRFIGMIMGFFLAGYIFLTPSAEMNFGPLDMYLNARVTGGIFAACAWIFQLILWKGILIYRNDKNANRLMVCCALSILIFVGCLSVTRPTQRYLLFVLPLLYFFILPSLAGYGRLLFATLLLCVLINLYIGLNQFATGSAAMDLTRKIERGGLINVTNPGVIIGHTGNFFPVDVTANKKYIIVAGRSPQSLLFSESHPLPFVRKTFSLISVE
jgi:hypothetical protein